MAVDHPERIVCLEGQPAGQHLVERDAEGIEVRVIVNGSVHATGLLGRDVLKRSFQGTKGDGERCCARELDRPVRSQ